MPHDFNDHNAAVAVCGRVNAVDCFRCNIKRRMKAERNVCADNIVINRLWKTDDVKALVRQQAAGCICAVAAEDCQRVEFPIRPVFFNRFDGKQPCFRIDDRIFERFVACSS